MVTFYTISVWADKSLHHSTGGDVVLNYINIYIVKSLKRTFSLLKDLDVFVKSHLQQNGQIDMLLVASAEI
jgi:hypothetical protein